MVNKVTLIGRAGQDPELRTLENGTQVARFGLATSRSWKDDAGNWQEITEWHIVVAWRQLAERAAQSVTKGDLYYVEGEIKYRKTEGPDGPRFYTDIVANYFRKVAGKSGANGQMPCAEDAPPNPPRVSEAGQLGGDTPATVNSGDDDLPF